MGHLKNVSHAILGQGDDFELWEEIISHIPDELFLKKDFKALVVACGHATEAKVMIKRMRALGLSPSRIKNAIVLNDKFSAHTSYWYEQGFEVVTGDFLEWETDMKFDVVIGNPPYQKSDDNSSFTNLWAKFVHKAWSMSVRYVCMITPKTWSNQVTKDNESSMVFGLIKNHATLVNIGECSKYFKGVGSSFSYYVLDKAKNSSTTELVTHQGRLVVDWSEIDFLPNNIDPVCLSILKKLCSRPVFPSVSSANTVGELSSTRSKEHPYSIRYSMGTEKWSDTPHKHQNTKKLVFPNQTTKNYPIYAPKSAPANRGVFYVVSSKREAEDMLAYIKSAPIQFLISQQRTHHGVLNTSVIKRIPKIDLSRTWTDEELYQHFGLTQEEIDYIEATVK